jgi:DNA-binding response OmpR family regulator
MFKQGHMATKKIVLVEDDVDLHALLKYNLEKEDFQIVGSHTGKGVVELCAKERPDLIILDIMLPDADGLDICKRLRSRPELQAVPLIFITARASETDRIVGLELGANDYIVKPFFVREVIARIKVQLRRPAEASPVLRAGALELDRTRCQVRLNGNEVPLTATEFRLLEFLMGRAVTDRTVDVYVLRLRQKLETDPTNPQLIRSVRGFGYSFNDALTRSSISVPAL